MFARLKFANALLACAAAFTGVSGLAEPFPPASPFGASVASAGQPTLAPIASAADDQPFVVKLVAPADGTGGFAVVVTKPSSGIARWKNSLPAGAMPLDLTDNSGRPVMVFLNPPAGRYSFALSVQLPLGVSAENPTGQDPFAEDALVVTVGGVVPAPPAPPPPVVVVPDPTVPPVVDPTTKATAAVYVYEKDDTAVPAAVMSGLNRLNREKKITATLFEKDTTDGMDDVPEQYKIPYAKAKEAGLPALVVLAGSTVLKVVKSPTTESAVMEAAQ